MSVQKTATATTNGTTNGSTIPQGDPDKTPVAQDVFTYCTKEKIDTWHVVMAHTASGVVDRVKCKACTSEHKYKSKKPLLAKKSASTSSSLLRKIGQTQFSSATRKSASVSEAAALSDIWFKGIKKWGEKAVISYSPETTFSVGEVCTHSTFGKGVVQGRRENRVDVLFEAGLKTLPSKSKTL